MMPATLLQGAREDEPVTLIGALLCDGYALVGSDSWAADATSGVWIENVPKVWKHGDHLAWGFAGDGQIGTRFREWLDGIAPPKNWTDLRASVKAQTSRLNKGIRQDAIEAGTQVGNAGLLTVVIAGYIGGEPHILETNYDGRAELIAQDHAFLGSGLQVAEIVYTGIAAHAGQFPKDEPTFRTVLEVAIKWDRHNCGPPVKVIRIDGP
jgi:hypothetical protein